MKDIKKQSNVSLISKNKTMMYVVLKLTKGEVITLLTDYNMRPDLLISNDYNHYYVVMDGETIDYIEFLSNDYLVVKDLELVEACGIASTLARRPFSLC